MLDTKLHFIVTILAMGALVAIGMHGMDVQWSLVAIVTGHATHEIMK